MGWMERLFKGRLVAFALLLISAAALAYGYGPTPQNAAMLLLTGMLMIILIPYGILQCFFGYRLFKLILGMIGFVAGALLGVAISGGAEVSKGVAILIMIVCGIGGAYASIALYFFGVFLVGSAAGAAIVAIISQGEAATILYVLGAVVIGVLALIFQKIVIVVSTAWSGAFSIILYMVLAQADISEGILLLFFWVLFVGGLVIQFRVSAKNLPDKVKDRLAEGKPEAQVTA